MSRNILLGFFGYVQNNFFIFLGVFAEYFLKYFLGICKIIMFFNFLLGMCRNIFLEKYSPLLFRLCAEILLVGEIFTSVLPIQEKLLESGESGKRFEAALVRPSCCLASEELNTVTGGLTLV